MKCWLMRNLASLVILFVAHSALAQQVVYKGFEVDSAAVPRGGMEYLTTFIQANLRKPIAAQAKGDGGRISISAIVEPDGRVTDVKNLNSFRPDCDREARRVFNLFNAWKPAYKDGKPVRQEVNIPVFFKANAPFSFRDGAVVAFFDANRRPVPDSSGAAYKQVTPVDTTGLPSGDVVVFKKSGKRWAEDYRNPFVRKSNSQVNSTGASRYLIGSQSAVRDLNGPVYTVDKTGKLLAESNYEEGKQVGTQICYHNNGIVGEKREVLPEKSVITSWYANGQIKQLKTVSPLKALTPLDPEQVVALWDSTGRQMIKEGNGRATYLTRRESYRDTSRYTTFLEEGAYQNGFKQGVWTGRYGDGSYFYEETYDNGICQGGKAITAGADTVRYTDLGKQPEFPGGIQGLGQFLSSNLQYPVTAQKANISGRVFLTFVVCTDGTLCDYDVLKGVHPDLDEEAVRVVKSMSGKWIPGVQRGKKVRVKYNLPINFSLH